MEIRRDLERKFVEDSNQVKTVMSDEDFIVMLERHAGNISTLMLRTPKIWGDPERIKGTTTIALNDLLLNTRSGEIHIGKDCFFGHGCALLTGTHDPDLVGIRRLRSVPSEGRDIIVKDGVWLASFVTVIGPAILGENSVAAAGSLILGNMEPNTIYAGRPAKIVRKINIHE